jgi:hypothetical protein
MTKVLYHEQYPRLLKPFLERLVGPPSEVGRTWHDNAWYAARTRAGNNGEYLLDVHRAQELAIQAAEHELQTTSLAPSIGREVRYALIRASLNSHAENIPEPILIAALKEGTYSSLQTLAYAARIPSRRQCANTLLNLVDHLTADQARAALWIAAQKAAGIGEAKTQSEMLTAIAEKMVTFGVTEGAISVVEAIIDDRVRAEIFVKLVSQISEPDDLRRLHEIALKLFNATRPFERGLQSHALAQLANRYSELANFEAAQETIKDIKEWDSQASALTRLIIRLSELTRV